MATNGSAGGASGDERSWGAAWLFFAAMVITLIGITHLVTGLTAASNNFDVWNDVPNDYLFSQKATTWAWAHLGLGLLLLVVAAFGLFSGKSWARPLAIVLLVLSAITAIVWIPYIPFWSAPILILDGAAIWMLSSKRDTA